jgi:hypothetical protein
MKNPRDILLNRYRAAEPKLDRLRHEVIDQEVRRAQMPDEDLPSIVQSPGDWLVVLWQQALRPWRPAWMGLAAAWALILCLHLAANGGGTAAPAQPTRLAPAAVAELQEQLRLRAELLGSVPLGGVKSGLPGVGPRSEDTRRRNDAFQTV